ncbi:MAG TPA: hypothetical protein VHR66_19835 [Gemmataceae bacterium]|jgi:hypothetical protein|nr:hypothetical protein [Gemmataceae bacterium]
MSTMTKDKTNDDMDRLFGAYFQAQLPAKWPAAPRPWVEKAHNRPAHSTIDPAVKSRWALAASVAMLLGGCWYLSGHLNNGKAKTGLNIEGGSADLKHVKDMKKDPPKMP